MSEITITLPDGSRQSVQAGTTPLDLARSISRRLADDALVARVNGQLVDLCQPIESDATLEILTLGNPEALEVYRHSTAHLLAAAVLDLFPGTRLGIGPATETGFFYDFYRDEPFTPEDLEKIEARMWELQRADLPYERKLTPKEEGLKKYAEMGENLKCELIEEKA
ncbi:MAG TPA: TGS domain-containing protein, partial [Bryobacteraceae bacterium]|nr:TGS domain-containing protein [Bryobacteraceae bacterium]